MNYLTRCALTISLTLFTAVCTLGLIIAATPVVAQAEADGFRLGVALGLTGTGAPYSKEAVEGIEIAVNEINSVGGILNRYPIKLFIRDTQTSPKIAQQAVMSLIRDHQVHAIIGTYSSACAMAIKPICRDNRVLHVATVSNSEDITKLDFSPFTFSVVPNTYMMAKGVVMGIGDLARKAGWKRYATIASDYSWGRSSQSIQVDLMRQLAPDLELVAVYWPRLGQTRFNSFVVDILAKKPDFVLGTIGGADNALWLRDARDYRLFKQVAYPGGLVSVSELTSQARSIRRGLYGRCRAPFFAHPNQPMMVALVKAYQSKYGRYPTDWAVMSYDGVHALRQGIESAGALQPGKIKDAMHGLEIDTTRGKLFFRKIDNQLSCSAYFGKVADVEGFEIPIYEDLMEMQGVQVWRTEDEIRAARQP